MSIFRIPLLNCLILSCWGLRHGGHFPHFPVVLSQEALPAFALKRHLYFFPAKTFSMVIIAYLPLLLITLSHHSVPPRLFALYPPSLPSPAVVVRSVR